MELTKSIIIDLQHPGLGPIPIIHAKPDDTARKLQLTLTSGGAAWTPPPGTTAAVRFRKPDSTSGIYDTMADNTKAYSITDNVVTVAIAPDVLSCPGDVMMDVLLVSASATLATFNITVRVQAAPALGNTDSGDFYKYTNLEQINAAIADLYTKVGSGGSGGSGLSLDSTLSKSGYAADAKATGTAIGNRSLLRTVAKTSLVGAVNELVGRVEALEKGSGSGGSVASAETWVAWNSYTIPFDTFPATVAGTRLTLQMVGPTGELLHFDLRPYAGRSFAADAGAVYGCSHYDSGAGFPVSVRVNNSGVDLELTHDSGSGMEMVGFFFTGAAASGGGEVASTEV